MPPRPLAGRTALLLRSADRAAPTIAELASRGAATVLCPLIDFELPADTGLLDDGVRTLLDGGFDWLVLTSRTAVLAVLQRANALGRSDGTTVQVPAGTRVAAVGEATAAACRAAGIGVDVVPVHDHSARGMLAEWPRRLRPTGGHTVFMPQADIASTTLADGLRGWGNDPVVATAYRTVDAPADPARALAATGENTPAPDLTPADLAAVGGAPRGVEAVLFTSPSIVRRYLALAGPAPHLPAIAIGDSTAAALRNHGWEPAATATEASPAGLANAWEHALDRAGPAHG